MRQLIPHQQQPRTWSRAVLGAHRILPSSSHVQAPPPQPIGHHSSSNASPAASAKASCLHQQHLNGIKEGSSLGSPPTDDLTELAGRVLQEGNGIARHILSDPELEGNPLDFLKQTEAYWKALKQQKHEPHKAGPTVITTSSSTITNILQDSNSNSSSHTSDGRPPSFGAAPAASSAATASSAHSSGSSSSQPDFDVVMCGGTLGICVALALQQKGFRVAVVEKRRVEGRLQEWNSSRHEVQVLVDMGLLTPSELEAAIVSEFNPIRVGFKGGSEPLAINNVLNIGVSPKTLIATLRAKFEVLGGVIYEHTAFKSAVVGSDGVVVSLVNAAGAPADVGDTNRPNALQQEQQVHLDSPFGRVAGAGPVAALHHSSNSSSSQHFHTTGTSSSSSGSNGVHASHGHSSHSGSRYDRWVAAATAAAGGSNGAELAASGSNGSSSSSTQTALQSAAQPGDRTAAAPTPAQGGSRRAKSKLTCRLLLDCMGHYSPIVKQLRGKAKPDGMVLVVGGCATGFAPEDNTSADLLYSITDAAADMQLFWEAFPAEGGASRTTYMFCYSDADPRRPTFEQLLDTYFSLLPAYQGLPGLDAVKFKRVLFGGFPCYSSATPLAPGFDRVLQLGDASATQSPLSFGGFGSLLRLLRRLSGSISHALQDDKLSRKDLSWIHPYQPSLSAAWLFQRSMSMKVGQQQQQQEGQEKVEAGEGSSSRVASRLEGSAGAGAAGTVAAQSAVAGMSSGSSSAEVPAGGFSTAAAHMQTSASSSATHEPGSKHIRSASSTQSAAGPRSGKGLEVQTHTGGVKPSWPHKLLLLPADHINALLGANFTVMSFLGQRVLKPFLQDTLQLGPLAATMFGMMVVKPLVISRVFGQVGPKVLLGWFGHFAMLTLYTLGYHLLKPFRHVNSSYTFQRLLDALKYGSSSDYSYQHAPTTTTTASNSSSDVRHGSREASGAQPAAGEEPGLGEAAGVGGEGRAAGRASSGRDLRQRQGAVVNNIVPGVPAVWGPQQVQQQEQLRPASP